MKPSNLFSLFFDRPNFTCDVCGAEVFSGERVCKRCYAALPFTGEMRCLRCGRASAETLCSDCEDVSPAFDSARSVFRHTDEAARLVVRFKREQKYLSAALGALMLPYLEAFPEAEALVYIPMTEKAEKRRGYNQSRLLAETLSKSSALSVLSVLEKQRETASQKFLGRAERAVNLKGSFRCTKPSLVKGKKLLLIDDTMTTGATLSEAAHCLKRAGAEKVFALTVTAVPDRSFLDYEKLNSKIKHHKS